MMNFIRFYNKNRHAIWGTIIAIILIFGVINTLNNLSKNNTKDESSSTSSTTTYNKENYSIISQTEMKEEATNQYKDIINKFIDYCNSGEIQKAYELLSNDCKEQEYSNVEKFEKNYFNKIFDEPKLCDLTAWITNGDKITYRIEFAEDILTTGNSQKLNIEDYYTIVKENGEYKLNIHNYIGKEEINKKEKQNNITFNILEKYVYMEYEIYKINVKNESNKKIMIDSRESTKNVNIVDQNRAKYIALLNEINQNDLIIYPGINKDLNIKFNKTYNPKYIVEYMEFEDIILDVDEKTSREQIEIEL